MGPIGTENLNQFTNEPTDGSIEPLVGVGQTVHYEINHSDWTIVDELQHSYNQLSSKYLYKLKCIKIIDINEPKSVNYAI